ncbi:hypothetical protein ACFE04_009921 [Oxalis oulophora]
MVVSGLGRLSRMIGELYKDRSAVMDSLRRENNNDGAFKQTKQYSSTYFVGKQLSHEDISANIYLLAPGVIIDFIGGVPVLPSPDLPQLEDPGIRFLHVVIENYDSRNARLIVDVTNMYIVGYVVNNISYILNDTPTLALTSGGNVESVVRLNFSGNYGDLERAADEIRRNLPLGITPLSNSVNSLIYGSAIPNHRDIARAIIVSIQMVSEAARFIPIQNILERSFRRFTTYSPESLMLSLENHWDGLGSVLQWAATGIMRSITLLGDVNINAQQAGMILALQILNRNVQCGVGSQSIAKETDSNGDVEISCVDQEVDITGLDYLCIGLHTDDEVMDGSNVYLTYECSTKWIFKMDGTIRTRNSSLCVEETCNPSLCVEETCEMCLTSKSYDNGSSLIIINCDAMLRDRAIYNYINLTLLENGTIVNSNSVDFYSLVVGLSPGDGPLTLTFQNYTGDFSQTWQAMVDANSKNGSSVYIIGWQGLCLRKVDEHNDSGRLTVGECEVINDNFIWNMFPDGSLRTSTLGNECLGVVQNGELTDVVLQVCDRSKEQTWSFDNFDQTIMNKFYDMYLSVNTETEEVTVETFSGDFEQSWYVMYFSDWY